MDNLENQKQEKKNFIINHDWIMDSKKEAFINNNDRSDTLTFKEFKQMSLSELKKFLGY